MYSRGKLIRVFSNSVKTNDMFVPCNNGCRLARARSVMTGIPMRGNGASAMAVVDCNFSPCLSS